MRTLVARKLMRDEVDARYRARSLWLDGIPEPLAPRPSLPGAVDCDVAIVGAGFTGLWAAYYMKLLGPELRVVVVEREIAGYGPSGRNGGWASATIAGTAKAYGLRDGDAPMLRAEREMRAAIDEIGRVVETEGIECGYRKAGKLMVATSLPQRARMLSHAGGQSPAHGRPQPDGVTVDAGARMPGVLASTFSPDAARVDPARLVRGLARACERLGVTIYEQTAALELAPGRVRCANGTVRADAVLQATEAYTTELPGEGLRYLPLYSLMIATEPLPSEVWEQLGWTDGLLIGDLHHLFFYAQRTADDRIAIGGRGAPYRLRQPISEAHERSEAVRQRLMHTLRRRFPAAARATITHHWGGPLAAPRDWSMSVSFDPRTRFGWAGGYTGRGVVASNICGRTLADLVLGLPTDRVTLPWVQHNNPRWEGEPLRFIASRAIVTMLAAADQREDRTGRASRRMRLLAPFMPH
jgi:glycine/D-amino acid oxidase-like deaminating enzyme